MSSELLHRLRSLGVTSAEISRELGAPESLITDDRVGDLTPTQLGDLHRLATHGSIDHPAPGSHTLSTFGQPGVRIHSTQIPSSPDARASALAEVRFLLEQARDQTAVDQTLHVTIRLTLATRTTLTLPELTVDRAHDELSTRDDTSAITWLIDRLQGRYANGALGRRVVRNITMNIYPKS